ncbi:nitrate reductase molybdenum cofactor assembly chaperone [Selenomonas sp. TAMA-11512]|uniref:nitrate reductase molybdenum cofactor assembly chaperone n=1 Tax=Selenomonas sp. TAMA-11512 TaxID=3095337 RepID=UPI0030923348|nr:nitrate reductase molybdenum cofactor assembly chaperone [Selenomonas sp. TAMA-11512]
MKDYEKTLRVISFLLAYPDETWWKEFDACKAAVKEIESAQNRTIIEEFIAYVEDTGRGKYEENYVEFFEFSQNTNLYLTMHDRTDFGKQANEMLAYKSVFLDHGYDIENELPDYLPAILELIAGMEDEREAAAVFAIFKEKIELLRSRFIEAKLVYTFLIDVVLTVAAGLEAK